MKRSFVVALAAAVCLAAPVQAQEKRAEISWTRNFAAGLKQAQQSGKPVVLDFTASWCPPCREMERAVWPERSVVRHSDKFVFISVDIDMNEGIAMRYNAQSIPTIILTDPFGNQISRHTGYMHASDMSSWLEGFPSDFTEVVEALEVVDNNANDSGALVRVAEFYGKLGAVDVSRKYYDRALKTEPLKKDLAKREEVFIAMGLGSLKLDDNDAARKTFERCLKECPDGGRCDVAMLGLVTAQLKLGKLADAEKTFAAMKARYPDSKATAQAEENMQALRKR